MKNIFDIVLLFLGIFIFTCGVSIAELIYSYKLSKFYDRMKK
jgi:Ca2+/Na+ antiporter